MKRYLSGLLSLSIVLLTPPPALWAQVASVSGALHAPVGAPGAVSAGAAALNGVGVVPMTSAVMTGAPALSAALAAPMSAPSASLPSAAPAAAARALAAAPAAAAAGPSAAAPALSAAKPVAAPAAPVLTGLPAASVGAKGSLSETAQALKAPGERPETVLERLFTGSVQRAGLAETAAPALGETAPAANSGLEPASTRGDYRTPGVPNPDLGPGARSSKLVRAVKMVGTIALSAAAALGLNALGAAFLPAVFGLVPVAALWAVSSGVLLFPAAMYARYRLTKRDSPRLGKVKVLLDAALGLYIGALAVALPAGWLTIAVPSLALAVLPAAGLAAGLAVRGAPFLNTALVWGALGLTPLAVSAAAVGGLAAAPILGMLALPAMTTIAFFLGSLIRAAESGRPFSVPGSLQKLRFPSFQWVMIGVVFALLTGYSAVHTNMAFLAWNFLGNRTPAPWDKNLPLWKNILNKVASFDVLYLGLLAWSAVTGFASPLTFLVIAFSGERAAVWTERLLTKFLPRANPAPSTKAAPVLGSEADKPAAWPKYHYWAKTFGILAAMMGVGFMMGLSVFGLHAWMMSAIPAVLLAALPFWFATKIIKVVMHDVPAHEDQDPEFFGIMRDLRERINTHRRANGKKEIPMPEMVIDPLPLPNAYATGRDPFHALVGVTQGIKEMTLDPENVRDGVARLVANTNPSTKAFRVFRKAIAGSVSGVTESSDPAEIQAAVLKADRKELKALGVRMLRGVLGHEFSHVMDRHMLSGSIAGAISSSIAFASYGVMWAVGHAQALGKKVMDKVLGRKPAEESDAVREEGAPAEGGNKTLMAEPITAGLAVKSLPALLKLFAALWVPVLVQIVQMASSRNNEGMADEDGALLSDDPQSLALALGLLTTWRPKTGFMLPGTTLPRVVGMSHIMTVNPVEQAWAAGALPKLDAFTSAVVGKGDDFLFDLFVTHPDTIVRIEKLHDMAAALDAKKSGTDRP